MAWWVTILYQAITRQDNQRYLLGFSEYRINIHVQDRVNSAQLHTTATLFSLFVFSWKTKNLAHTNFVKLKRDINRTPAINMIYSDPTTQNFLIYLYTVKPHQNMVIFTKNLTTAIQSLPYDADIWCPFGICFLLPVSMVPFASSKSNQFCLCRCCAACDNILLCQTML